MGHIPSKGNIFIIGKSFSGFTYGDSGIPSPSGSLTFDDFDSYTDAEELDGLNSGSNEWDNTSPLAAYFARESFYGIKEWDDFNSYAADTSLSASMPGSGSPEWSGSYDYYGREAFFGIKMQEYFKAYDTGSTVSGSNAGTSSVVWGWNGAWNSRTTTYRYGIRLYEDFSTYTIETSVSGSDGYPYEKWNNVWSGSWDNRLNISGSV